MIHRKLLLTATLIMAMTLAACGGGGGSGESSSSSSAGASSGSSTLAFPLNVVVSAARFLLFPNPQRQGFVGVQPVDGLEETNTTAYANAYYAAIDGANERLTKNSWKAKNGFGNSATGTEVTVVFGDRRDLGYGRRMTARRNNDGSLAFFVDNYLVDTGAGGGYTYSSLNVDAAVVQSSQRFVSTSAIEFSDINGTGAGNKFVKFYVFDTNGNRKALVDQDGLGVKAMPEICVSCHGGRADKLTSAGSFPVVGNARSQVAGDTVSRLQGLKVHTFDFSALNDPTIGSVRSRAAQEAAMKTINQWVHDAYASTGVNEWDGTVAQSFIETVYGGAAFPNATYSDAAATTFLPDRNAADTWTTNGQAGLYQNVVGPACMTCHILRGTKNQDDIAFTTFAQFDGYADRVKAHVYDRGNMPLVKLVFNEFWNSSSTMPQLLAGLPSISAQGATSTLKPGRPIADPGPDRFVRQGTLNLSAINSLYASSFSWSIVTNPGGATFTGATNTSATSLNFPADGTYVIRLTAAAGNGLSSSKDLTIVVDNANAPNPASLNFTTVKGILVDCQAGCHQGTLTVAVRPPLSYDIADYGNDNNAFYKTVISRINFTDVAASPLLRKPSGNHHNGGWRPGFNNVNFALGDFSGNRASYDLFVEWIMAGAPQ